MKKTRSDSVLGTMAAGRQAELEEWLFEGGIGYRKAVTRLREKFGVRVSMTQVRRFYAKAEGRRVLERLRSNRKAMKRVADFVRNDDGDAAVAVMGMVGWLAFEETLKERDKRDLRALCELTKLMLEGTKCAAKVRRVQLAVDASQFDATQAALGRLRELRLVQETQGLSETDKLREARRLLFGMLPDEPWWEKKGDVGKPRMGTDGHPATPGLRGTGGLGMEPGTDTEQESTESTEGEFNTEETKETKETKETGE